MLSSGFIVAGVVTAMIIFLFVLGRTQPQRRRATNSGDSGAGWMGGGDSGCDSGSGGDCGGGDGGGGGGGD